jgi:hypothetical protein
MYMHVHMRHFLEGSGTNRVPQRHAFVGESPVNGSGDLYRCSHQRSTSLWIKVPYVIDVRPGNHQNMAGIVLTRIDKRDCQVIGVNDVSRRATCDDLAEDALRDHGHGVMSGL